MPGVDAPTSVGRPRLYEDYLALCVMAIAVLVTGCAGSKDLTRSRAADLIRNSKDFRLPVSAPLPRKREWPIEARSVDETEEEAKERAVDSYARANAEVAVFRHLGLIDFRMTLIEAPSPAHSWWRFELEPILTNKGEREAVENDGNKKHREIAVARRELVEVTGITTPKAGTAQAEFTWEQVPTPAGEAFDPSGGTYRRLPEWLQQVISGVPAGRSRSAERRYGDVHKGVAFLQLYDDGWRVRFIQF